jgi:soluble lytic murein transglycosylase-like protein
MAVDGVGSSSDSHVSFFLAGALRRGSIAAQLMADASKPGVQKKPSTAAPGTRTAAQKSASERQSGARAASANQSSGTGRSFNPHTAVSSSGPVDPDRWDGMLNRVAKKYNVPALFLKAVMLSESGGRPDAVGDSGHSVGLFQLHDHGYGTGMGDARFDPETNADRGAKGLAEAWRAGEKKGLKGEYAVRAAYDYSFNPGGGFAYQGDSVVKYYNQLLAEQGQPRLA